MPEERTARLDGFAELDRLLEHRVRLAICLLLSRGEEITFSRFKELLGETDGNLGANLRKLEDEGYVEARKELDGRKPVTWYGLSKAGGSALEQHLDALTRLTQSAGP